MLLFYFLLTISLDEQDRDRSPFSPLNTFIMARLSGRSGAAKPFTAWTTIFYLLLVFIAPLALLGTAHAEEESVQDNYGTGMSTWIRNIFWDLVANGA